MDFMKKREIIEFDTTNLRTGPYKLTVKTDRGYRRQFIYVILAAAWNDRLLFAMANDDKLDETELKMMGFSAYDSKAYPVIRFELWPSSPLCKENRITLEPLVKEEL